MSSDNSAAAVAELDRLHKAVLAAPAGDTSAEIALWQQVTQLETWFFIARGSADRPTPYGVGAEQGPMLCLYSSAERANEAARLLGLADAQAEGVPLMGVPVPAALDWVSSFSTVGVWGLALDHPQIGHFIPLANLGFFKHGHGEPNA